MLKYKLAFAGTFLLLASAMLAVDCKCGLDYCLGDAAYVTKLKQNKLQRATRTMVVDIWWENAGNTEARPCPCAAAAGGLLAEDCLGCGLIGAQKADVILPAVEQRTDCRSL